MLIGFPNCSGVPMDTAKWNRAAEAAIVRLRHGHHMVPSGRCSPCSEDREPVPKFFLLTGVDCSSVSIVSQNNLQQFNMLRLSCPVLMIQT